MKTSGKLLSDASEIVGMFSATEADEKDRKECELACRRIEKFSRGKEGASLRADPEHGIFPGDGSFLKALLQLIVSLLPLFITPTPPPAG